MKKIICQKKKVDKIKKETKKEIKK